MTIIIDGTGTITGATTLASTVASPTFTTPALGTPASGDLTNCTNKVISGTAQASTSGTSIDFTGIPSGVKRVTVMFQGVSSNSTSLWLLRLGTSSGVTISGYLGIVRDLGTATSTYSAGFTLLTDSSNGDILHGLVQVATLGSNNFAMSGILSRSDGANQYISGGSIALGGVLDRVRITTVNGTDTFDAGLINILYES